MLVLVRLLRFFVRLLFFPLLFLLRRRAAGASGWIGVELDGAIEDVVPALRFWQLPSRRTTSLHALGDVAREVANDPRARGLVVTLRDPRIGMATATSLRDIFLSLRAAEREVVVHLPYGGGTKECFVAVAGSRIFVGPQATVSPFGFALTTAYVRQALAKVGVVPEVMARGKYKSAGETLVRDDMSEPQKEQLGAILDTFHEALVAAVTAGRGVAEARARELIDQAPYLGEEAVTAGLADGALYDDTVAERLEPAGKKRIVSSARFVAKRGLRLGPILREPVIAVVRIHCAIVQAGGASWMRATDARIAAALARARKDRRVLGVVVHIDSPGGSALASDRIHHEIVRLAREKPVVACMANVAASGGYYVAVAAHAIVAQPTTLTGSIGVVAARIATEPLLAKLGVHTEVVTRGARAGLLHPTRPLSSEDRAALEREIEAVYRAFVGIVADGRKRTFEEIDALAQGRVWSGKDAHARGLVDELGGFDKALDVLRARIGPRANAARVAVVEGPRSSRVRGGLDSGAAAEAVLRLTGSWGAATSAAAAFARSGERVLAWADWMLD